MSAISVIGIVRNGQVELPHPLDLPDGSEVVVTGTATSLSTDPDPPLAPDEIARRLAAMELLEGFDWPDEERAAADAWEKRMEQYGIEKENEELKDMFR